MDKEILITSLFFKSYIHKYVRTYNKQLIHGILSFHTEVRRFTKTKCKIYKLKTYDQV